MADPASPSNRIDQAIGRLSASLVAFAHRHPTMVVVVAVLATGISLAYAVRHLGVSTDTRAMLSEELPFRRVTRQLQAAFPHVDEPLIVVVDGETPERARSATASLAAALAERPDAFRSVFAPGVGTFFDKHGLLYADTDALQDFADRLIVALPMISQLARRPTLTELLDLVARSVDPDQTGAIDRRNLPDMYEGLAELLEAPVANDASPFSLDDWAVGRSPAGEQTRRVIIAQPVLDYTDLQSARKPIAAVRGTARELGLTGDRGVTVRVTGDPALNTEEMDVVARQAGVVAVGASLVVVTTLLLIALRSVRLALVTVLTLGCGLAWTTGFAALAIGRLSLVSVPYAVLFVGLAVDFGIHFGLSYRELRDRGHEAAGALVETGRSVGSSITLCALTTAIGFYAFIPTRYAGVAELGIISGTGMFFSLTATLLVFPALLTLTGVGSTRVPWHRTGELGAPISQLPVRHPGPVCAGSLAVAALCLLALPFVHFDPDPVKVRDPATESVEALTDLLVDSPVSPWTVEILAPSLDDAERIAAEIEQLDSVSRVVTLTDFIPEQQAEKLAVLEDVSFFTEPLAAGVADDVSPTQASAATDGIRRLRQAIADRMRQVDEDPELHAALRQLDEAAAKLGTRFETAQEADDETERIERALLGDLPEWIERLNRALEAERIAMDDLPESIRKRYLSPDGHARVEVYPAGDLSDRKALQRFVDSVQAVVPASAGAAIEIVESGRAIVVALQRALTTALIAVTVLLLLLWRSARETLLVLMALMLAGLVTAAATVVIDLPLNFADVIVVPLLLGIGVDSGIHLVHRYRVGRAGEAILRTSTARAILFSALTTIASFGSLAFSTHRGIASLGLLLTLGVSFMLMSNLIFLPALITWVDTRVAGNQRGQQGLSSRAASG